MNALNIISGFGSNPSGPPRSRTSSVSQIHGSRGIAHTAEEREGELSLDDSTKEHGVKSEEGPVIGVDEKTPLLQSDGNTTKPFEADSESRSRAWRLPRRIADAIVGSLKVVIATIAAPGFYLVACFYDEHGSFSAMLPIRKMFNLSSRKKRRKSSSPVVGRQARLEEDEGLTEKLKLRPKTEEGEDDALHASSSQDQDGRPAHNTRSRTAAREEVAPAKRSIRIKLHNEAAQKRRYRTQKSIDGLRSEEDQVAAVANSLKSPSSPISVTKLKYPRVPAPPRPLVPRRQPSYTTAFNADTPKKTLIIDLDETLIHSMAKGGRMSTGHMVEVKIQGPIGGSGIVLGPQVPILYYVHERPYCHEFLRKVCKWYNLIAFTASVQEYADPVIDWLERERAYFSGRYYRQHCTFRNGAYIKDLSQVEPDLSKVMILDNSPMSYIFHEDNAIPIEGWISDPTDNDLLHLVPLLEGLQYVTDVRALLALRLGQADRA